mmetsp:Transcript_25152/g.64346  ORF Transcript_25152/g.64346 Transcript_25152/m.64346 type:complete len:114 (+) Transcript_25152:184-525(+)
MTDVSAGGEVVEVEEDREPTSSRDYLNAQFSRELEAMRRNVRDDESIPQACKSDIEHERMSALVRKYETMWHKLHQGGLQATAVSGRAGSLRSQFPIGPKKFTAASRLVTVTQ